MKLTRRKFVKSAVAGTTLLLQRPSASAETNQASVALATRKPSRPNVIFILADDLGWGDLSCYGRPDYRTPNIDRLASEGTEFTDAYSASAVCTPTRCASSRAAILAGLRLGSLNH